MCIAMSLVLLQLPATLCDGIRFNSLVCKFWPVRFENGMDQRVMEHIVIGPVMDMLDEDMKSRVHTVS